MKLMSKSIAVVGLFVSMTSFASAADLPSTTTAPRLAMPEFAWTGIYAGVHVGYAVGDTNWRWNLAAGNIGIRPAGVAGGLHIGYNYQLSSNFVIGVEGSFSVAAAKKTTTFLTPVFAGNVIDAHTTDIKWFGDISLRAGLSIDRFLLFVKGGLALGQFRQSYGFRAPFFGNFMSSATYTQTGFLLGGGLEYAFTNNLLGRIEYNYMDFGTKRLGPAAAFAIGNVRFRNTVKVVKAGVSYKF